MPRQSSKYIFYIKSILTTGIRIKAEKERARYRDRESIKEKEIETEGVRDIILFRVITGQTMY